MEGGAHSYRTKKIITMASRKRFLAFNSSEDDTQPTTFTFKAKENLIHAKQMRAKARKTIKTAKRTSWQQLIRLQT